MQVTKRTNLQAGLQNTIFIGLLIIATGLIAWLSIQYEIEADWTVNNRHSLSEASKLLLVELSEPIMITAYVSNNNELRRHIKELVERYQRHKSAINLRFVDPVTIPGEMRERGIQTYGKILITYEDRTEHVRQGRQSLSEQALTSALQRLARTDTRLVLVLEGHGERSPTQFEDYDLSQWAQALKETGFEVQTLNFAESAQIPTNAKILVITEPQTRLLPGEINLISDYIDQGGNLLWLLEPKASLQGLEPIAEKFGLTMQPGIIVDPTSQLFGVDNPTIVLVTTTGYIPHPITTGLEEYVTLFPQAGGLIIDPLPEELWDKTAILMTNPQVWSETEVIEGTVQYDEDTDIDGPLEIAFALVRDKSAEISDLAPDMVDELGHLLTANLNEEPVASDDFVVENIDADIPEDSLQEQRVIIVGESDFLSNAFIEFGGNSRLSLKMMNWLALDDALIDIPTKTAADLSLNLSSNTVTFLGLFFLFILPLGLVMTGVSIWLRRRKA
jgi:ABC-type uncharacterized transport system involved in gliding motility auxiliary subunit